MIDQQNSETEYCKHLIKEEKFKNGQYIAKQHTCLLGMCSDETVLANLVPLSEILPLKIVDLLLYLYHLCEYVLELYRKRMSVYSLDLKEIKVSKDKNNPFVYVRANSERVSRDQLRFQIQTVCFRLSLPIQIYLNNEVQQIASNILDHYLQLIGKDKSKLFYEKQFLNIWRTLVWIYNIPEKLQSSKVSKAIIGIISRPSFLWTDQDKVFMKIAQKEIEGHHLREIDILEMCQQCPYLPKIYGYFRYQSILITFYKIHKATLEQFNKKIMDDYEKNIITQQQIIEIQLTIFQNLLKAIQYLHKNKIVHRDLKPLNIMLDYEDENEIFQIPQKLKVVIIDFDNSIIDNNEEVLKSQQQYKSNYMGTQLYAPPEIAESNLNYTDKVDIYQLGLIFLDMIKGCRNIYKTRPTEEQKFKNFIDQIKQQPNKINQNERLVNLFLEMISFKQEKRPTSEKVLQCFEEITKTN